ncbi:MAG: hypothetical protein IPP64_10530 [Bacteroidetes bacterium]|nr:hypothetical protein [Bacteroidota bacterium]
MKTKTFILTLLALITHAVVSSQTPANQAFEHNKNFILGYANYTEAERREFSMVDDPSILIMQSEELLARAKKIKMEAGLKRGEEQKRMIDTANELIKQANTKKLAACELLAFNNRAEFKLLKAAFINNLENYDQADSTIMKAKSLLLSAVRSYRFATELREEAYAQKSIPAILANLHNAEERESLAIVNIVQAMQMVDRVAPQVVATR